MRRRIQKETPAAAAGDAAAALRERFTKSVGLLPGVLTPEAVVAEYMPPPGESGLPPSLEAGVPHEYRYWLAGASAAMVRKALVEARLFTPETVLLVDDKPVRVEVEKRIFAIEVDEPAPQNPRWALPLPAAQYAATLLKAAPEVPVAVYEVGQSPDPAALSAHVEATGPWLAAYAMSDVTCVALRKSKVPNLFLVPTRPGVVFASNTELAGETSAVQLGQEDALDAVVRKALSRVRFSKQDTEERYVMGIVLVPEERDAHGDIYSEDEVRKAQHRYMERYRDTAYLGQQHGGVDVTGKLLILESYLAPVDFELGGVTVKKGTWLMAVRVVDDELWEAVKRGDFTGFSIGGDAWRTPEVEAPAAAAA